MNKNQNCNFLIVHIIHTQIMSRCLLFRFPMFVTRCQLLKITHGQLRVYCILFFLYLGFAAETGAPFSSFNKCLFSCQHICHKQIRINRPCQTQLCLMNGNLQSYMFRFQRNHHQAVCTKPVKHTSSTSFCTLVGSH